MTWREMINTNQGINTFYVSTHSYVLEIYILIYHIDYEMCKSTAIYNGTKLPSRIWKTISSAENDCLLVNQVLTVQSIHYYDVIMSAIASRITSLTTVYLIVYSRADKRKHQSSASLAFVRGVHRRPVNSPHKGPVTRKMVPFDDAMVAWPDWQQIGIDSVAH